MGLDMTIYLEKDLNRLPHEKRDTELIYWRKCYYINDWFNDRLGGLENCHKHYIDKEVIEDLLWFCEETHFDSSDDGCFYSEEEKNRTIKALNKILKEVDFEKYKIYYWAWW